MHPDLRSCDPFSLAAPGVRGLRPYQPGKPESELRRELGLKRIVKLASNENPLGPGPLALAAARDSLAEVHRYPDGNGFALKQALARHHDVDPAMITLGNGSNDVLELIARAFLSPGQEAVYSAHAFAVYPLVTRAIGAVGREASALAPDSAMPHGHDLAAMQAQIGEHTRLVFIANPNNPTGTWVKANTLEAFLAALPEHVLAVVDEAYCDYVERPGFPDASQWLGRFPNLIVTRTFSKAHGLAGLRVGYSLSQPAVADLLNRVRQPFNVNIPALAAAEAALADHDYLARSRALNRAGMAQLGEALTGFGFRVLPSLGNFLCVAVDRPGRELFDALLRQGVIVRPVDNYGLENFLRISIGTEDENRALIEALQRILAF